MADTDDPAFAAARLEAALERIAALAEQVASGRAEGAVPGEPGPEEAFDVSAVADRLDSLIAKLRAALAGRPT